MTRELEEKKYHRMLEAPVEKLMLELALPAIVSMLCTSFYNMADTFYVSKINTSSTAAVGVTFATMSVIQAIAFFFGIGSGNSISRLLGAKEHKKAEIMAATSLFYSLFCGILLAIAGNLFVVPIAANIGSTPTILPYAVQYLSIVVTGAPIVMGSLTLNNHLRFQGSAAFGMIGITIGGFLNVALDPLFIFTFRMGIAGAAYATVLSQCVSFCILLMMTRRGGNLAIRLKNIHPSMQLFKEVVAGGAPSLMRQGTASVATICLNVGAGAFGDAAIAAMSIVTRLSFFAAAVIIGFGQGFQPICGFSYGAKKYARLRKGFWFALKSGMVFAVVAALAGYGFADLIIRQFRDDPSVIHIGIWALRCQTVTFILVPLCILSNQTLQTTRHTISGMLVAAGCSGLFLIPAVAVLPKLYGIGGLVWCQGVLDICAFTLAAFLMRKFFKNLPEKDM